jgi:hypothetical protein
VVEAATLVNNALTFGEARSGTPTAHLVREADDDRAAHLRGDDPSDQSGSTRSRFNLVEPSYRIDRRPHTRDDPARRPK